MHYVLVWCMSACPKSRVHGFVSRVYKVSLPGAIADELIEVNEDKEESHDEDHVVRPPPHFCVRVLPAHTHSHAHTNLKVDTRILMQTHTHTHAEETWV